MQEGYKLLNLFVAAYPVNLHAGGEAGIVGFARNTTTEGDEKRLLRNTFGLLIYNHIIDLPGELVFGPLKRIDEKILIQIQAWKFSFGMLCIFCIPVMVW